MFNEGDKVRIKKLSKASYFLYKSYKDSSQFMICPCACKHVVLTVIEQFSNKSVLMRIGDNITIAYAQDLALVTNLI